MEEGRGLVVIVNKMDLLRGRENRKTYESVINAVPEEIQTVIPQVCQDRNLLIRVDIAPLCLPSCNILT